MGSGLRRLALGVSLKELYKHLLQTWDPVLPEMCCQVLLSTSELKPKTLKPKTVESRGSLMRGTWEHAKREKPEAAPQTHDTYLQVHG